MTRRKCGNLGPPDEEERVAANEERVWPLAREEFENRVDFVAGASVENFDLQRHGTCCCFRPSRCGLGKGDIGRIDEHGHTTCSWHQLAQEF